MTIDENSTQFNKDKTNEVDPGVITVTSQPFQNKTPMQEYEEALNKAERDLSFKGSAEKLISAYIGILNLDDQEIISEGINKNVKPVITKIKIIVKNVEALISGVKAIQVALSQNDYGAFLKKITDSKNEYSFEYSNNEEDYIPEKIILHPKNQSPTEAQTENILGLNVALVKIKDLVSEVEKVVEVSDSLRYYDNSRWVTHYAGFKESYQKFNQALSPEVKLGTFKKFLLNIEKALQKISQAFSKSPGDCRPYLPSYSCLRKALRSKKNDLNRFDIEIQRKLYPCK